MTMVSVIYDDSEALHLKVAADQDLVTLTLRRRLDTSVITSADALELPEARDLHRALGEAIAAAETYSNQPQETAHDC